MIVDDQIFFRQLIIDKLINEPYISIIAEAANGHEAVLAFEEYNPDVILMDINMPDCNGFEATKEITQRNQHIKILMLTSSNNIDDLNEAFENGSIGFIRKNVSKESLIIAIQSAYLNIEIIQRDIHVKSVKDENDMDLLYPKLLLEKIELERLALTDKLTGIWNRRYFEERVSELQRNFNTKHNVALLIIDIDKFKDVNDNYGHIIGDNILIELSNLIKSKIRVTGCFARWGGEEFVIMMDGVDVPVIKLVAEKLRQSVEQTKFCEGIKITISIGVAMLIIGENLNQWFKRADEALYQAKLSGRNKVIISNLICSK